MPTDLVWAIFFFCCFSSCYCYYCYLLNSFSYLLHLPSFFFKKDLFGSGIFGFVQSDIRSNISVRPSYLCPVFQMTPLGYLRGSQSIYQSEFLLTLGFLREFVPDTTLQPLVINLTHWKLSLNPKRPNLRNMLHGALFDLFGMCDFNFTESYTQPFFSLLFFFFPLSFSLLFKHVELSFKLFLSFTLFFSPFPPCAFLFTDGF